MINDTLIELFLISDETKYRYHTPSISELFDSRKNITNDTFTIDNNFLFYIHLYAKNKLYSDNNFISMVRPKYLMATIMYSVILLITSLFSSSGNGVEPIMGQITFWIINLTCVLGYLSYFCYHIIKNRKILKKIISIKRTIRKVESDKISNELKELADDIIDDDIKLLRRLKLKNIKK